MLSLLQNDHVHVGSRSRRGVPEGTTGKKWGELRVGVRIKSHFWVFMRLSGMTMLCVTHEMGFAQTVVDEVIFMAEGEIVERSPPKEFFNYPQSERTRQFLGQILKN